MRRRPAFDKKSDFSVAGESSSGKRQRKHRAMKRSREKETSMRMGTEMHRSGGKECAEMETTESSCFAGKENFLERDGKAMSGESKIMPFRDSVS